MDSATALITALAGEEIRWTEQSKQFDLQIQRLTGRAWQILRPATL
jgi:dynein heavy chain